jgi:hypothetical protein
MSQHGPALKTIEKEADLEGYVVRPLSGALLPQTLPEKSGLIKRENLGIIRGRTRRMQLEMAKDLGIENPPNAGGGCLLTDPAFAIRAKDLFKHVQDPNTNDIDLLKIGRHFRLDKKTKLIVGRNKDENEIIKALALPEDLVFYAKDHVGPNALLRGKNTENYKELCSAITLRYSDAPKETNGVIIVEKDNGSQKSEILTRAAQETDYIQYRI